MGIEEFVLQMQGLDQQTLEIIEEFMQREKQQRKERQAEGIRQAKERGVLFGRPSTKIPDIQRIYNMHIEHNLSLSEAAMLYNTSRSTIYRRIKEYEQSLQRERTASHQKQEATTEE